MGGCCCGLGIRISVILVAIWAIIQSIGYIVMSVMGMMVHDCHLSMTNTRLNYLMYLAYFRDAACGPINWQYLDITVPAEVQVIMPSVTDVAIRTQEFLLAYLIISIMWIVASIMLITVTYVPCMSPGCIKVCSWPWLIVTLTFLVLSAVATGYHIHDITQTTTLDLFLSFIQVKNKVEVTQAIGDVPLIFVIPAVIMTSVSSGIFFLWIINLSCLIYIAVAMNKIAKGDLDSPRRSQPIRRPDFGYDKEYPNEIHEVQTPPIDQRQFYMAPPPQERSRYNDINPHPYQYDNPEYVRDNFDYPDDSRNNINNNNNYTNERRYLEPLKGGTPTSRSEDGNSSRLSNPRSLDSIDNVSKDSSRSRSQTSSIDRTIDDDRPTSTERLSYMSGSSYSNGKRLSDERPPVKPKPTIIRQPADKIIREESLSRGTERTNYQVPPDELRGQLPWSYFQNRDELTRPKKRDQKNDVILPPVPVPDYTLHFPKKERPPTRPKPTAPAGYSNEKWSGPEYKY